MHRLSKLFHYIVCDIHKVVDRADSVGSQTSLHPFRRRTDLDVLDNSCCISRAKLRILYRNLNIIRCILIVSGFFYCRRDEFLIKSSCCLSCNSKYSIAVYTVGCDLIFKYNIIKAKCFDRTFADNCILREDIDAVFRCFRIHFSCASQFFDGAHHSIRFDSSELSFFDLNPARSCFAVMAACNTSAV